MNAVDQRQKELRAYRDFWDVSKNKPPYACWGCVEMGVCPFGRRCYRYARGFADQSNATD